MRSSVGERGREPALRHPQDTRGRAPAARIRRLREKWTKWISRRTRRRTEGLKPSIGWPGALSPRTPPSLRARAATKTQRCSTLPTYRGRELLDVSGLVVPCSPPTAEQAQGSTPCPAPSTRTPSSLTSILTSSPSARCLLFPPLPPEGEVEEARSQTSRRCRLSRETSLQVGARGCRGFINQNLMPPGDLTQRTIRLRPLLL
mmetsp:Transcript_36768/g.82850  ORF Transcript_36768/g.82850 Transcript_36768/m.82850 type:complete len:203 (+) Transcript_36768:541-1149(+)